MFQLHHAPAARGAVLALVAAALFGAATPFVQRLGVGLGPWTTAALLYLGAATFALFARRDAAAEAPLRRQHFPRLLIVAMLGAVLGPVALAWGLQRTSAFSASLLLTFEAVFTALLARLLYREAIDRRIALAMMLIAAGGVLLFAGQSQTAGAASIIGLVAILVATLAWAGDNAASRTLADVDPGAVVLGKAALGVAMTSAVAIASGEALPWLGQAAGLFAVGAAGYGLSLRFYLLAQRQFGAARTGSVFAAAPFVGAAIAAALGERDIGFALIGAAALMAVGVLLHVVERHAHPHHHPALEHEHAHRHDDGHHLHTHDPMPAGAHSHWHRHEPMDHSHPHVPDLHHRHEH